MFNKKMLKFVVFILIIVVIIGIYFFVKDRTEKKYLEEEDTIGEMNRIDEIEDIYDMDEYDEDNINRDDIEKYRKNITVNTSIISKNDKLVKAILKNENNVQLIDMQVYIVFYDENKNIINIEDKYVDFIDSNEYSYIDFDYKSDNYEIIIGDDFEIDNNINNMSESISFNTKPLDNGAIELSGQNLPNEDLSLNFIIKYYDENNELIDMNCKIIETNSMPDFSEEINDYLEYGKYEIELLYAI